MAVNIFNRAAKFLLGVGSYKTLREQCNRIVSEKQKSEAKVRRQATTLTGLHLHVAAYKSMVTDLCSRLGVSDEEKRGIFEGHCRSVVAKQEASGFRILPSEIPCRAIREERMGRK